MAMTHMDGDFQPKNTILELFMSELENRAIAAKRDQLSKITAGVDGEPVVSEWQTNGVRVIQRPNDPQDVLRISVGGGDDLPVSLNYCVFRGDRGKCVDLLRKALKALESDPE